MPRKDPEKRKAYDRQRGRQHYAQTLARMTTWSPERLAEHARQHRASTKVWKQQHPERVKANNKRSRMKHAAQIKTKAAKYYQVNAERINQKTTAYSKQHPAMTAASQRKRRAARKHASVNDFTAQQWAAMKEAYQHRCVYCDRKMQRLTQDHIQPLSKGGSHTYSNIVPACKSCNSKKGAGAVLKPVQPLLLIA